VIRGCCCGTSSCREGVCGRACFTGVHTRVRVVPATGPPTSTVKVSGTGFGAFQAVDIYFDTTDEALVSAGGTGAFSGVAVRVPASAVPGRHYVTAVARHTGRSAQARFLVNTNWAQFRYSAVNTGFNPYENVLSRVNVAGLGLAWARAPGGLMGTASPVVANGVVYLGFSTGKVYALDAATGAEKWAHNAGGGFPRSSPAVDVYAFWPSGRGANHPPAGPQAASPELHAAPAERQRALTQPDPVISSDARRVPLATPGIADERAGIVRLFPLGSG
jgi:PQQ enzyme repeat